MNIIYQHEHMNWQTIQKLCLKINSFDLWLPFFVYSKSISFLQKAELKTVLLQKIFFKRKIPTFINLTIQLGINHQKPKTKVNYQYEEQLVKRWKHVMKHEYKIWLTKNQNKTVSWFHFRFEFFFMLSRKKKIYFRFPKSQLVSDFDENLFQVCWKYPRKELKICIILSYETAGQTVRPRGEELKKHRRKKIYIQCFNQNNKTPKTNTSSRPRWRT